VNDDDNDKEAALFPWPSQTCMAVLALAPGAAGTF
jgi:hypothetical protein